MIKKYPQLDPESAANKPEYQRLSDELEVRVLVYLRDGFSYEMKEIVDIGLHNNLLTFECEPMDEQYKVGSFIVTVPFDEIARVEVFAVHPQEKPENVPFITGFRSGPPQMRDEPRDM